MVTPETQYIFNSLLLLAGGLMAALMAAGFCLRAIGLGRTPDATAACITHAGAVALAPLMFALIGYHLMVTDVADGYAGAPLRWQFDDSAAVDQSGAYVGIAGDYAASADWFYQAMLATVAALIVAGAVGGRMKPWSFLLFAAMLTGLIYPLAGAWAWGGGWLKAMGFYDFAGATVVHSAGGWAALIGVWLLGPSHGRRMDSAPPALPLAVLGTFLLWIGWLGLNGASQLAFGTAADASAVARIAVNTQLAASGGLLAVLPLSALLLRRIDPALLLNGAVAGLVSISAAPLTPGPLEAACIGAAGGLLMMLAARLLERLRVEDEAGLIPVHLAGGIWGTLAAPISHSEASIITQITGIVTVGCFMLVASLLAWLLVQGIAGLRVAEERD